MVLAATVLFGTIYAHLSQVSVQSFTTICVDMVEPSPLLSSNVTIGDLADDIPRNTSPIVRNRDRPLILLGHSMGVQVVLEYLQRHGQEVAAAVLICGSLSIQPLGSTTTIILREHYPCSKRLLNIKSPVSFLWKAALESPLAFPCCKAH